MVRELLEFILNKALPTGTDFRVEMVTDAEGEVYTIFLPTELKGRIIGKQGKNINAIRTLAGMLAREEQKRIRIDIAD